MKWKNLGKTLTTNIQKVTANLAEHEKNAPARRLAEMKRLRDEIKLKKLKNQLYKLESSNNNNWKW